MCTVVGGFGDGCANESTNEPKGEWIGVLWEHGKIEARELTGRTETNVTPSKSSTIIWSSVSASKTRSPSVVTMRIDSCPGSRAFFKFLSACAYLLEVKSIVVMMVLVLVLVLVVVVVVVVVVIVVVVMSCRVRFGQCAALTIRT